MTIRPPRYVGRRQARLEDQVRNRERVTRRARGIAAGRGRHLGHVAGTVKTSGRRRIFAASRECFIARPEAETGDCACRVVQGDSPTCVALLRGEKGSGTLHVGR